LQGAHVRVWLALGGASLREPRYMRRVGPEAR
jgi:hypothetical protein